MEDSPSTTRPEEPETPEQRTLRKALELSRRDTLPKFSLQDLLSRVPNDWKEGEDEVDEFLASIRTGRKQ
jgi:hypothetical protein